MKDAFARVIEVEEGKRNIEVIELPGGGLRIEAVTLLPSSEYQGGRLCLSLTAIEALTKILKEWEDAEEKKRLEYLDDVPLVKNKGGIIYRTAN